MSMKPRQIARCLESQITSRRIGLCVFQTSSFRRASDSIHACRGNCGKPASVAEYANNRIGRLASGGVRVDVAVMGVDDLMASC